MPRNRRLLRLGPVQRRRFLRWFGVAAAAVGLENNKLLQVLADQGGERFADALAADVY